jgi:hypothetical protein
MNYEAVTLFLSVCVDCLYYRYCTRVLSMRSNALFWALEIFFCVTDYFTRHLPEMQIVHNFTWMAFYLMLPVALSRGSLTERICLVLLGNATILITEFGAAAFYALITGGGSHPEVVDATTFAPVVATYLVITVVAALLLELVYAVVMRHSHNFAASAETPVILFMLMPPVTYFSTYAISYNLGAVFPEMVNVQLAYFVLLFVAIVMLFVVVQRDAQARRALVQHRGAKRQLAALKQQLSRSSVRRDELRRFRHDLANQIQLDEALLEANQLDRAEEHLVSLHERAVRLSDGQQSDRQLDREKMR